jgi:hypothetical protein
MNNGLKNVLNRKGWIQPEVDDQYSIVESKVLNFELVQKEVPSETSTSMEE